MMLFAGIGRVSAQMSDDQILDYVKRATAAGRSEQQIGRELLSRGVRINQLQQIKARLQSEGGSSMAASQGITSESRLRNSGAPAAETAVSGIAASSNAGVMMPVQMVPMQMPIFADSVSMLQYNPQFDPILLDDIKPIYGHQLFNNPSLTFEPNENISTPENYKLGPGDEIYVDIWGSNETSLRYTISPEGDIMVSQIGPVYLTGLTIKEAGDRIRNIFARKYEGVSGDDPSSDIRVSLGKIRTIRVNIMGEVATPGTYRLSGFASLFHALYSAGGITPIGSLRNIQVVRSGKTVATVDVYKYLFEGKQSVDIRLQEDDVVIVPAYSILVGAEGQLKRPMYYELMPNETLADLVKYAGGFTGSAYADELQIVRSNGRMNTMLTVPNSDFASAHLVDGDVVTAGSILGRFDNRVEVNGAVYREGAYELSDKISTVRRLINAADGVKDDAFLSRALLTRKKDDYTFETIQVNLEGILNGTSADIALMPDDVLYVQSKHDVIEIGDLTINGMVSNPGKYDFAENTTIEDLILKAGGLLDGASMVKIEVARRKKDPKSMAESNSLVDTYLFDMKDGYIVDGSKEFYLEPFDVVHVRRSPAYQPQRNVTVDGEVLFAGSYSLRQKNERLSDLVFRAGGVTSDAYVRGARLIRMMNEDEKAIRDATLQMAERSKGQDSVSVASLNISDIYTVGIELDKALERPGSDYDMVLREGDRLVIPEKVSTVRVNGAVMYPNTVLYQKGKNVKYYISQGGGYQSRARRSKAYIIYMNGTVAKVRAGKGASQLEPGCEIIVPSKGERKGNALANILSITSATTSLGLMAASLATLANRF